MQTIAHLLTFDQLILKWYIMSKSDLKCRSYKQKKTTGIYMQKVKQTNYRHIYIYKSRSQKSKQTNHSHIHAKIHSQPQAYMHKVQSRRRSTKPQTSSQLRPKLF